MVKSSDIVLVLVAILCPPVAVAFMTGCSCDLLINILLTLLGYIPGHIHAFYCIFKKTEAEERYGRGNVRYVGNNEYQPIGHVDHTYIPQQPQQQPTHYGTA